MKVILKSSGYYSAILFDVNNVEEIELLRAGVLLDYRYNQDPPYTPMENQNLQIEIPSEDSLVKKEQIAPDNELMKLFLNNSFIAEDSSPTMEDAIAWAVDVIVGTMEPDYAPG